MTEAFLKFENYSTTLKLPENPILFESPKLPENPKLLKNQRVHSIFSINGRAKIYAFFYLPGIGVSHQ